MQTKLYSDEKQQGSFNLCQRDLPADSDAHGDWIFLNGSQNALIEYQVGTAVTQAYILNMKIKGRLL